MIVIFVIIFDVVRLGVRFVISLFRVSVIFSLNLVFKSVVSWIFNCCDVSGGVIIVGSIVGRFLRIGGCIGIFNSCVMLVRCVMVFLFILVIIFWIWLCVYVVNLVMFFWDRLVMCFCSLMCSNEY